MVSSRYFIRREGWIQQMTRIFAVRGSTLRSMTSQNVVVMVLSQSCLMINRLDTPAHTGVVEVNSTPSPSYSD